MNTPMTYCEKTPSLIGLVCINQHHFQCDLTPIPDWFSSRVAHSLCSSAFIYFSYLVLLLDTQVMDSFERDKSFFFVVFTCSFSVSTYTVKSCLAKSRWMAKTISATEMPWWTCLAAKDVRQIKTKNTHRSYSIGIVQKSVLER